MKELRDILAKLKSIQKNNKKAVLATVVKVQGSTYRRPGARMLMNAQGEMIGSISGGCLEEDVWEHGKKLLSTGGMKLLTYDTTAKDDMIWGLGLGCNGIIEVLLEILPEPETPGYIDFLQEAINDGNGALATVFRTEGNAQAKVGDRVMFWENGKEQNKTHCQQLPKKLSTEAKQVLDTGKSLTKKYSLEEGEVEVLLEALQPVPLIIFGAGHDAIPLAKFAKELGWHVSVVDSRSAYLCTKRFPYVDNLISCSPDEIMTLVPLSRQSAAVIMTHNYSHDQVLLANLLNASISYIGALGPKKRTQQMLEELEQQGSVFAKEQLSLLYGPVGIDTGAESPEEIAISIIAEIQAVRNGRGGGLLRERMGPIHG